ncbi:hypothetical protein G9427_00015 [Escherichia coli]|uniref:hypothetical protein n=1 Tax=Escherichia coli TaxID=562 RepID=UPI00187E0B5E|nr:hypothetical protein [Escherichia coli]MBE8981149.1 hypothetical protein [Escherichia coli]
MLTDHQIQLGHDIAEKLEDAWRLRFRNVPPAPDTLLACGAVLALMRLQTEETKNPFYTHAEVSELVGYALALPELKDLDSARLSDDLVRICVMFRIATIGYHGFILGDEFFLRYMGWATYNA